MYILKGVADPACECTISGYTIRSLIYRTEGPLAGILPNLIVEAVK